MYTGEQWAVVVRGILCSARQPLTERRAGSKPGYAVEPSHFYLDGNFRLHQYPQNRITVYFWPGRPIPPGTPKEERVKYRRDNLQRVRVADVILRKRFKNTHFEGNALVVMCE